MCILSFDFQYKYSSKELVITKSNNWLHQVATFGVLNILDLKLLHDISFSLKRTYRGFVQSRGVMNEIILLKKCLENIKKKKVLILMKKEIKITSNYFLILQYF